MQNTIRPYLLSFSTLGLLALASIPAHAQSGSRSYPPSGSAVRGRPAAGSGQRAQTAAPLALEGYCPVSLKRMNKWVKGSPSIQSVFDGHTVYFANQQGKQMFDGQPAMYVPVLGGDCAVSYAKMGKRVPGNIRHAALHEGRLFLFANAEGKQMFMADPKSYADADLAYGGNCVVCRVNMQQTMPGKPELTVLHKGLRYLFPSTAQRDEFLASPGNYEVAANAIPASSRGSGSRQPARSGSGSRS